MSLAGTEAVTMHSASAHPTSTPALNRRTFLAAAASIGSASLFAGCDSSSTASSTSAIAPGTVPAGAIAGDAPETPNIKIGIIALTDCSPFVIAHEKGLFAKYGIHSTISKGASWAAIRDSLANGDIQATHLLFGMPFASTMGLLGAPKRPVIIPWIVNRNGQAISLKAELKGKVQDDPNALKPLVDAAKAAGTPMTFAMLPGSRRHSPGQRCCLGHGSSAANGRQHEDWQDGRILRRRALERPRHFGWHRLHFHHHAANVEGSSGKGLCFYGRVREQES
jgi:nitrate/nitrite transport system substrate-binding protein